MTNSIKPKYVAALATIVVAVLVLFFIYSLLEFRHAEKNYVIANSIKNNFFERSSIRDQYFLHQDDRLVDQWDISKQTASTLLQQASVTEQSTEGIRILKRLQTVLDETAVLFHRIVNNHKLLNLADSRRPIYEEADKRLSSQLLLRAAVFRDAAIALEGYNSQRIRVAYQRVTIIAGLIGLVLAIGAIYFSIYLIRKEKEAALAKSEEQFRLMFENIMEGVVFHNSRGEITSANQQALNILGLTLDQLQGRTSVDPRWHSIHEDGSDFPGETHPAMVALATGKPISEVVMGILNPVEKQTRWISVSAVPLLSPVESKPDKVFATFSDITEHKHLEDELRESETRFRHFFEKNKSVMLLIEPTSGAIIEANQAAAKYYGFEQHRLIGMSISDINILPLEEVALERQRALHEERNYFNFRHRIASGELRDVEVYSTPAEVSGKSLLFSVIHDITGRKNLERQKLEEREHMVNLERMSSLGTMVGGVAHEINNPLMGVINYVEFARDKAVDPKSMEVLDLALHEINRIKKIVQNMMVFVHIDSASTASCNVTEAVNLSIALLDGEFQKHAIQVSIDLADGLPQVKCNLGSLEQVLINLLLNARDALEEQAERRITIKGMCENEKVVLTVSDNGPGIKEEALTNIFVPFFTTKPVGKGTGLGLAVSRQLVEKYGGSLRLQDEKDVGACFRLEFNKA